MRRSSGSAPIISICSSSTARDYNTPVEETLSDARPARPRRQDPLYRRLQLLRLAPDEVARPSSDRYGYPRHVAHQAYYSLLNRDYEWELMPLGARPGRRARWCGARWAGASSPARSAAASRRPATSAPARHRRHRRRVAEELLFNVVDALDAGGGRGRQDRPAGRTELAAAAAHGVHRGHRCARRGAAASQNLGAVGWNLTRRRRSRSSMRRARRRRPIRSGTSGGADAQRAGLNRR